ncbi:MAG: putative photosynthetic complex assembly protein PuhE [Burkholderiales bacterium]|jgi:putative photosynthetic complex assembly protein 2|nr:putative photosynthetic complex assembly protein PuhE [Burkholderiales bacterium]
MDFLLPPLFALFVWWFGTGVVMLLDGLPRDTFRWSLATSGVLAFGALVCIAKSADNTQVEGAYGAFTCAVLVWGWHELAFLTGWLTGPRKRECSAPAHGPTRFGEAVQAILWHELGLVAMGLLIVALTWGAANPVASWTFGLLWVMRLSAKLNLFLGVRNRGEQFLPPHLVYLGSYFRRRTINALLPLSLLVGSAVVVTLIGDALAMQGAEQAGRLLVASLLVLALLEHVLMVTPLQGTALWRWAMRSAAPTAP